MERFDPVFKKIPSLRLLRTDITKEDRPGGISPRNYATHFMEREAWDIHPSKIRVRGKYFSKLYQQELREPMKRHIHDTGSSEVQIASLTAKIDYLSRHVLLNRKDVTAKRQIIRLAYRRRRLLHYLYRKQRDKFDKIQEAFKIDFVDDPFTFERLDPKFSHMTHRNTKRYKTAREAREAKLRKLK